LYPLEDLGYSYFSFYTLTATNMLHQTLKAKSTTRRPPKASISAFISKTFEILEDCQFPDIVDWNFEGTCIVIKDPLQFSQQVLNIYFKHRNLTSFVRQLNMYGFRKQRTPKIEHVYCHELFQRGKKHLLDQIKRKSNDQISLDVPESEEKLEPIDPNMDLSLLMQEKQALKRYNTQASTKINCLEGKVKDLILQNQTLRQQMWQQDERDKILISLMANILRKYGIPPTELSLIMRESSKEPLLLLPTTPSELHTNTGSGSGSGSQPTSIPELTSKPSFGPEDDISNYLNLDAQPEPNKTVSNVLNNMTNYEGKSYARDISPHEILSKGENDSSQWDPIVPRPGLVVQYGAREGRKGNFLQGGLLVQSQNMKEKEKGFVRRDSGSRGRQMRKEEINIMGKRRFEDNNCTVEVIKKKVEINPGFISGISGMMIEKH